VRQFSAYRRHRLLMIGQVILSRAAPHPDFIKNRANEIQINSIPNFTCISPLLIAPYFPV